MQELLAMWKFLESIFGKKPQNIQTDPTSSESKIVAAKVIKIEKHPNADRLRVISLDGGKNGIIEPVVCGAFNFEVGDMVVLALPGARIAKNIHSDLHEPFTLDKAKIRGIESQGMICAEFELGASDNIGDKPEIMVLPVQTVPGTILNY